jgi:hypothetical protein
MRIWPNSIVRTATDTIYHNGLDRGTRMIKSTTTTTQVDPIVGQVAGDALADRGRSIPGVFSRLCKLSDPSDTDLSAELPESMCGPIGRRR